MSEALRARGGRILAISVDPPEASRALVAELGLGFSVLDDADRSVLRDYGLLHAGAGPQREDIAIPANPLVDRDGRIRWRHVSRRIQDRPDPGTILREIARF